MASMKESLRRGIWLLSSDIHARSYAPYNPQKVNQDSLLLKEDTETGTLVVGTFDGHGDHGHKVSDVCKLLNTAEDGSSSFLTLSTEIFSPMRITSPT